MWFRRKTDPAIEERLRKVEGEVKALALDFEELFDKVKRYFERLRKRQAVDGAPTESPPTDNGVEETLSGFEHLDPISRKLMLDRRRHGLR